MLYLVVLSHEQNQIIVLIKKGGQRPVILGMNRILSRKRKRKSKKRKSKKKIKRSLKK